MQNLTKFDEYSSKLDFDFHQQFILTKKNDAQVQIILFVDREYRIIKIDFINSKKIYFPFREGGDLPNLYKLRIPMSTAWETVHRVLFIVTGKQI